MSRPAAEPASGVTPLKPPGAREFTPRAVVTAVAVAAIIGASYPYIVLKLGFGPNISVVSAFFGFLALGIAFRDFNRWENNIVQSAGTAAGSTAFLCVLMAAFDMLRMDSDLRFTFALTPIQVFAWLTTAGLLGVLLSVPMRQHFVVEERLTFADGIAAGETLIVLDSRGAGARDATRSMGLGTGLSALIMTLREDTRLIAEAPYRIPGNAAARSHRSHHGRGGQLEPVEPRRRHVGGPESQRQHGDRGDPGVGHRATAVAPEPRHRRAGAPQGPAVGDVACDRHADRGRPGGAGSALETAGQDLPQPGGRPDPRRGLPTEMGDRRLRRVRHRAGRRATRGTRDVRLDDDRGDAALDPADAGRHPGVGRDQLGPDQRALEHDAGDLRRHRSGADHAEHGLERGDRLDRLGIRGTDPVVQDRPHDRKHAPLSHLRTVAGGPNRRGSRGIRLSAASRHYGIGGENGLQSPISQEWAGFAKLLSAGLAALPHGALHALAIAVVLGVLFTVLEGTRIKRWTPSPTGIGIGMLVPASAIITMFLGAVAGVIWTKASKQGAERNLVPLASGFIAGEAIVAVIVPILVAIGLVHLR